MASLISPSGTALTFSDGVDMYGCYFELVQHASSISADGKAVYGMPRYYYRVFVAGNTISTYKREANKKSTVWRIGVGKDRSAARDHMEKLFSRPGIALRGEPILVQLRPTDVISISKNIAPGARYEGQKYIERVLGKFDPADWQEHVVKTFGAGGALTGRTPPPVGPSTMVGGSSAVGVGGGTAVGGPPIEPEGGIYADPSIARSEPGSYGRRRIKASNVDLDAMAALVSAAERAKIEKTESP